VLCFAPAAASACDTGPFVVHFRSGSATVTPPGRDEIGAAASMFRALADHGKTIRVQVTAGADTVGAPGRNLRLSRRRTAAIRHELERHGVPRARIDLVSRGETMLFRRTRDGVAEQENRAAKIELSESCG
jgi:outer membrane protein OmpA-like peptidoglycan-associated protein